MKNNELKNRAFTLVELSIVLVIVGLITGGVLAGRDLISGAELRKIAKDGSGAIAAVNVFKLKYDAIPGDLVNPQQFFNDTTFTTALTSSGWNGNGNGRIEQWSSEACLAMAELVRAGLFTAPQIDPSYGLECTARYQGPGNVGPVGTSGIIGYYFFSDLYGGDPKTQQNSYTITALNLPCLLGAAFSGLNAKLIDQKVDDGLPATGQVHGVSGMDSNCLTGSWMQCGNTASNPTDYNLTSNNLICRMLFY